MAAGGPGLPDDWCAAGAGGAALDLAVFDGGLLSRFLDVVGPLLPVDERSLAEEWNRQPRRLLEVRRVRPWRGVETLDLVTGDEIAVLDQTMSRELEPKDLNFGRPLPDVAGALRMRSPPVLLPRHLRSGLLDLLRTEASAEDVAEFFGSLNTPPRLVTSEGEELVACTARYDVPDIDTAWQRLAEVFPQGDDRDLVVHGPPRGKGTLVRGRISRAKGRVVVETNAVERLRWIQSRLLEAVPDARLVDESTRPFADVEPPDVAARRPSEAPLELPAELREQVQRHLEETWLQEPVPALGGLTPLEAAADPEARAELRALLDDFGWRDERSTGALTMDVDRLRRELGLL